MSTTAAAAGDVDDLDHIGLRGREVFPQASRVRQFALCARHKRRTWNFVSPDVLRFPERN
jgi:hypothetical protein